MEEEILEVEKKIFKIGDREVIVRELPYFANRRLLKILEPMIQKLFSESNFIKTIKEEGDSIRVLVALIFDALINNDLLLDFYSYGLQKPIKNDLGQIEWIPEDKNFLGNYLTLELEEKLFLTILEVNKIPDILKNSLSLVMKLQNQKNS